MSRDAAPAAAGRDCARAAPPGAADSTSSATLETAESRRNVAHSAIAPLATHASARDKRVPSGSRPRRSAVNQPTKSPTKENAPAIAAYGCEGTASAALRPVKKASTARTPRKTSMRDLIEAPSLVYNRARQFAARRAQQARPAAGLRLGTAESLVEDLEPLRVARHGLGRRSRAPGHDLQLDVH